MGLTTEDLLARLTSAYEPARSTAGSNLEKLMGAFAEGYWADVAQNIIDIRTQSYYQTATGGALDRHVIMLGIVRGTGESDASLRLRFAGAIGRLRGNVTPDGILEFVEGFLGASHGDVHIIENTDPTTGVYRPGYFQIEFDLALLGSLGFPAEDWVDVIEDINEILDTAAAAGVKGEVVFTGGAEWDSDTWDTEGDAYGA